MKVSACVSLVIITGIMITKSYIPLLFTNDQDLVDCIKELIPIYCVYYFFDSLQGSQIGIIKGMGLQFYGTLLNILSTWMISIPISAYLTLTVF